MRVLVVVPNYPYPTAPHNGAQNERCARVLSSLVDSLVVVSPRPFVPAFLALRSRWKHYASIPHYSIADGIEVHRPAYLVVPGLMRGVWSNEIAHYVLRGHIGRLHRKHRFDAILSFDLCDAGGLAWRISRDLGIPAAGWATGGDMRRQPHSRSARKLVETITNLDLVFYQSQELLELAAEFLKTKAEHLEGSGRHRTLSRGIVEPPESPLKSNRDQLRSELAVAENEVMILYLGRIIYEKGLFGLLDVFAKHSKQIERLKLILVGSQPGFDESAAFTQHLKTLPDLRGRVSILPACSPEKIWGYFNAADIFAFPSFKEGMPNSLLEAMISGVPSVTFDIAAIHDIAGHDPHALLTVPRFDYDRFFEKLLLLSRDEDLRKATGARGKNLIRNRFSLLHNMKVALDSLHALK